MPRQMIAYNHLLTLDECQPLQPYLAALHVCATDSLHAGMRKKYQDTFTWLVNAGPFINMLLGSWTQPATKLAQFTRLTNIIREEGATPNFPERLRYAFRHNQQNVLLSMRVLTEMGIQPDDVSPTTLEETLFQRCWLRMEAEDGDFSRIRDFLQNPDRFKRAFGKYLEKEEKGFPPAVVLHGFYFITPLQQRILRMFEAIGTQLIFLNLYDEHYPNTFASVEAFLGKWVPRGEWQFSVKPGSGLHYGDRFSSSFEGRSVAPGPAAWPPGLYGFLDFSDFLSHYKEHDALYISPKEVSLNDRLKEYVPEAFDQRHFLSYPIGQYLFHLHLMWNERKSRLELTEKSLFECFASGWLIHEGRNGRQYIKQLHEIFPYFQGCVTLENWRKRAKMLVQIQEGPVEAFGDSENRFQRIAENPMLRFSYFQVSAKDVRAITNLIETLFVQAEVLFTGARKVSIRQHFEKLEQILAGGMGSGDWNEEERKLTQELLDRLRRDFVSDEKFYVEDLSYAISLYLGGDFLENGNEPEMKPVRQYEDADGAALLGSHIHLCGIDEESLPYNSAPLPWPLTRDTLWTLPVCQDEVSMLFMREQFAPQIARYLFYSVLAFSEHVDVSWIRNMDNLTYEESMYVTLLDLDFQPGQAMAELEEGRPPVTIHGDATLAEEALKRYPTDAAAEAVLCPRRFYYSLLAQPFATFSSDFHQQFLFQALLQTGYRLSDSTDEEVTQQMSELFRQWSSVRKRAAAERAMQYKGTFEVNHSQVGNRSYVRGREAFQFLVKYYTDKDTDTDLMEPVREAMRNSQPGTLLLEHIRDQDSQQLDAHPTKLCRFCPHLNDCVDGQYAVDSGGA
ncbi:hypothetical protein ACYEXS_23605 [Paenibacillus sp. MAH-36]|uniref:PD-(D/E)XK nuclease superfamily protein n=1 Tax=Paenibacillus violae TaxID=3077234 RepID=A0ABU3RNQ7_9BACL|nr:hypothetical protein [Paenibacillus sp. PFR10]MDU0205807.1 hypothetical protein [Paenibacillus sp. PFR10]